MKKRTSWCYILHSGTWKWKVVYTILGITCVHKCIVLFCLTMTWLYNTCELPVNVDRNVYMHDVCKTRLNQEVCTHIDRIMNILWRFSQLATAFQEGKVTRYCLLSHPPYPKMENMERLVNVEECSSYISLNEREFSISGKLLWLFLKINENLFCQYWETWLQILFTRVFWGSFQVFCLTTWTVVGKNHQTWWNQHKYRRKVNAPDMVTVPTNGVFTC